MEHSTDLSAVLPHSLTQIIVKVDILLYLVYSLYLVCRFSVFFMILLHFGMLATLNFVMH